MGKFIAVIIVAMILVFGAYEGVRFVVANQSAATLNQEDIADRQSDRRQKEEWTRLEQERYESMTTAINVFAFILSVGVSLSLVAGTFWITYQFGNYLYNRSVVHYARDGIKPIILERGDGYSIVRDTNLSTEANSIIQTPTLGSNARHALKGQERQIPIDRTVTTNDPVKQLVAARAQNIQLASVLPQKPTRKQIEKTLEKEEEIINANYRPTREFTIVDANGESLL